MSLKIDYYCFICKKIQKDPVDLPCNCLSICKQHMSDLLDLKQQDHYKPTITCPKCANLFEIPSQRSEKSGFVANKLLQSLIEKYFYLNDDEKQARIYLDRCLTRLESLANTLSVKIYEFPVMQYDHFASIKYEVNIKREILIQEIQMSLSNDIKKIEKINRISDDMISQIECTEFDFKRNFDEIKSLLVTINISEERNKLNELFRDPQLVNKSNCCICFIF
jgi:hypothetical protein